MIKKLLTIASLALLSMRAEAAPTVAVLTPQNTLTLLGTVDEQMVEHVATTLPRMLSNTIYVNIVSTGGSIQAGKRIIDQLTAAVNSGKQIVCVPHLAVSMAFVILQSSGCPERMGVSSSVLMQHQPSLQIGGSLRNVINLLDSIVVEIHEIEKMQADRLGISVAAFREATNFDWWLNSGKIALRHKTIDSIGNVVCSPALLKKKIVREVQFFLNTIKIESSACPYIIKQKVVLPEKKNTEVTIIVTH